MERDRKGKAAEETRALINLILHFKNNYGLSIKPLTNLFEIYTFKGAREGVPV